MRLFVAINFSAEIKIELLEYISRLKEISIKGKFTKADNLHLTLAFIGETNKINEAREAVSRITASPFVLCLDEVGIFKRESGDIRWIGVEKCIALLAVQKQVSDILQKNGFILESREFKPHITLGRDVVLRKAPDFTIKNLDMIVSRISLMKSERYEGELIYTEIYGKELI